MLKRFLRIMLAGSVLLIGAWLISLVITKVIFPNETPIPRVVATASYVTPNNYDIVKVSPEETGEVREYGYPKTLDENPNGFEQRLDGIFVWVRGVYEGQPTKWFVRLPNASCDTGKLSIALHGYYGKSFWVEVATNGAVSFYNNKDVFWSCGIPPAPPLSS